MSFSESCVGEESSLSDLYEVRTILAEKVVEGLHLFKIRWKGYSAAYDTWEPVQNLVGCEGALAEWKAKFSSLSNDKSTRKRKRGSQDPNGEDSDSYPESNDSESALNTQMSETSISRRKTRATHACAAPGTQNYRLYREKLAVKVAEHGHRHPLHPERVEFLMKLAALPGPEVTLYNEVDDDPSPPLTFEFVPRYVMGDGVVDFVEHNFAFWGGCTCRGACRVSCTCQDEAEYKSHRPYDQYGHVKVSNKFALHECNDRCSCEIDCPNRVVQRGRQVPLEIFKTEGKGWGVRSPSYISKGTFIDTYTGELITSAEAERRQDIYDNAGCSYLFNLDKFSKVQGSEQGDEENGADGKEEEDDGEDYVIDAQRFGGVTRYINHSCDPNLDIYAVTRERADRRLYDLALFANKDIEPYEEFTLSYMGEKRDVEIDEPSGKRWPCLCGARNCVGYLWS